LKVGLNTITLTHIIYSRKGLISTTAYNFKIKSAMGICQISSHGSYGFGPIKLA
jgi:hypothetical protein